MARDSPSGGPEALGYRVDGHREVADRTDVWGDPFAKGVRGNGPGALIVGRVCGIWELVVLTPSSACRALRPTRCLRGGPRARPDSRLDTPEPASAWATSRSQRLERSHHPHERPRPFQRSAPNVTVGSLAPSCRARGYQTHAFVAAPAAAGTIAFVLPWPGGGRSRWRLSARPPVAPPASRPTRACQHSRVRPDARD
jgi:hypothetical protein